MIFFYVTKIYFLLFYLLLGFVVVRTSINLFSILFFILMLWFSVSILMSKKWIFELTGKTMFLIAIWFIVLFVFTYSSEYLKNKFQITILGFIGIEMFFFSFIIPYYYLSKISIFEEKG